VVIAEGLMEIKLSWDMTLCGLLNYHRSFGKTNCLHLKDLSSPTTGRLVTETA